MVLMNVVYFKKEEETYVTCRDNPDLRAAILFGSAINVDGLAMLLV